MKRAAFSVFQTAVTTLGRPAWIGLFVLGALVVPVGASAQGICSNSGAACASDGDCIDLCENKVCSSGGMSCNVDEDCGPDIGCNGTCSRGGNTCSGFPGQERQCDGPGTCSFPGETCYKTTLVLGSLNGPEFLSRIVFDWSTDQPIGYFQDQLVSLKMDIWFFIAAEAKDAKGADAVLYTDDMIINSVGQPLGGRERPVTENPGDTGIFWAVNASDGTMFELQSITGVNPMVDTTGVQYRVLWSTGTLVNIQKWDNGVNLYSTNETLDLSFTEPDWDCDGVVDNPLPVAVAVSTFPEVTDVGESLNINVLVTADEGRPQGEVRILGDELSEIRVPLEFNGEARVPVTYQEWGRHFIEAEYGGSWRYQLDLGLAEHFVRVPTTTTLTPSLLEFPENTEITITAAVTAEDGGTPEGFVDLLDNGVQIDGAVLSNGQAVFARTFSGGFHSLTANYRGSPVYTESVSPSVLVKGLFATTTTINSLPNPSQFRQQVTLFAAVDSSSIEAPEGVVEFRDNGVPIGQRELLGAEVTLMTTELGGGVRNVTAHYLGRDIWLPSSSAPRQHEVTPIDTTTDLVSDPNPSVSGDEVTFTAYVTPTAKMREQIAKGTAFVAFRDGNTLLGARPLDENFEATLTTSALPVGQRLIRAEWGGDPGLNASVSATMTHEVLARTFTRPIAEPLPALTNEPITVTATVTSNAGTPTGTVRFVPGGEATLDGSGQASVEVSFATPQQTEVIAFYNGDGNRAPSSGLALVQVFAPTLMVSLEADPDFDEAEPLNNVDLIAAVSGTIPGEITYTFYCNRRDESTTVTPDFEFQTVSADEVFSAPNLCDYSNHGIYYPKVIAERGVGGNRRAAATFTDVVVLGRPLAGFGYEPPSPNTTSSVTFSSTSEGPNLTHKWDFDGDGVTDSSQPNPVFRFEQGGQKRVKLTVSNSYGSSDFIATLSVQDTTPHIVTVDREFPGFFVADQGVEDLENELLITPDWKGGPAGTVEVRVNNGQARPAMPDGSGRYRYTLAMETLQGRFAPNKVEITPVTPGAVRGRTQTEFFHVFPWPQWMEDFEATLPGNWLDVSVGSGVVTLSFDIRFPPEPQIEENSVTIPGFVPYVGGKCGVKESFAKLTGGVESSGRGFLTVYGQTGVDCAKGSIEGSISGTGKFDLRPPSGLRMTSATFNLVLSGTIKREKVLKDIVPGYDKASRIPVIGSTVKKIGDTGLSIGLSPTIDLEASFKQPFGSGIWEFSNGTGKLDLEIKATAEIDLGKVEATVWLSLGGGITLEVPADPDLFTEARIWIEAGAELEVDVIFVPNFAAKARFTCNWKGPLPGTVSCKGDPSVSISKSGMRERFPDRVTLRLVERTYDSHGAYAKFRPRAVQRSQATRLPATTLSTSVVENLFPGADPQLTDLGGGEMLLLWLHDDLPDPIQQCTEVRWSRFDGASWSLPADIVNDTQFEQEIRTGVDDRGRVVAAWRRIKDTEFDPPPVEMEELQTWLQNYEVVTSTFDPQTSSWSPIVVLTDDLRWDADVRIASSPSGDLLLTWLSSNGESLISTANGPATLHWTTWNSSTSSWNSVETLATGLVGVDGHTSAYRGSSAVVMLSRDPDIDAMNPAVADEVIEYWLWNGGSWTGPTSFASGGGYGHTKPQVQFDQTDNARVIWLRSEEVEEIIDEGEPPVLRLESELVMATIVDPAPQPVREDSSDISFRETEFLSNADGNLTLLRQRVSEEDGPAEIYALIYDDEAGMWSADRKLTEDPGREAKSVSAFFGTDGVLRGAYVSQEIQRITSEPEQICECSNDPEIGCQQDVECGEGGFCTDTCELVEFTNLPVRAGADLRTFSHSLVRDLAVFDEDLILERFYTELVDTNGDGTKEEVLTTTRVQFPEPDDQLRATIKVRNTGDFVMQNFEVALFLGDPAVDGVLVESKLVSEPLAAAMSRDVEFDFTWPATDADIYVVLDPQDLITEVTRVNNQTVNVQESEDPVAIALADIESGLFPLTIRFDGSASFDPENGDLDYAWIFGDGTVSESAVSVPHTFGAPGVYDVILVVTDPTGRSGTDAVQISVGPLAPECVVGLGLGTATGGSCSGATEVPLTLENPDDIVRALRFTVADDPSWLTCTACELSSELEAAGFSCSVADVDGACNVIIVSLAGGEIAAGADRQIARIAYTGNASCQDDCQTSISLSLTGVEVSDAGGESCEASLTAGALSPCACGTIGDPTCDQEACSLFDILATIDQVLGDPDTCEADVNCDGGVNIFDALCQIDCALGLPPNCSYDCPGGLLPSGCAAGSKTADSNRFSEHPVLLNVETSGGREGWQSRLYASVPLSSKEIRGLAVTFDVPTPWRVSGVQLEGGLSGLPVRFHQQGEQLRVLVVPEDASRFLLTDGVLVRLELSVAEAGRREGAPAVRLRSAKIADALGATVPVEVQAGSRRRGPLGE